jgi:Ser/Thr protein kinase RdoA (MazF antagonist)
LSRWPYYLSPSLLKKIISDIDSHADLRSIERWDPAGFSSFRYQSRGAKYYLRIADTPGHTYAPEAEVLRLLHNAGVHVPQVVYEVEVEPETHRALLILSEMPGKPMATSRPETDLVALWEAGQELARMKAIRVDGFGPFPTLKPWNGELRAGYATFRRWIRSELLDAADDSIKAFIGSQRLKTFNENCGFVRTWEAVTPVLAHGDLHPGHLFHERFSFKGFVDFRSVLGADEWYDVATFLCSVFWDTPAGRRNARAFLTGFARQSQFGENELDLIRHRTITLLPSARMPRDSVTAAFDFLSAPGALVRLLRDSS